MYGIQGLPTCLRRALVSLSAPCYISFSTGFEMVISFSLTASVEHRPGYIYSIFYTRNRVRIKQETGDRDWQESLLLSSFFFSSIYIHIRCMKYRENFSTIQNYRNSRRLRRILSTCFHSRSSLLETFPPSFPGAFSIRASPSVTMERLLSAWKVGRVERPTRKDRGV